MKTQLEFWATLAAELDLDVATMSRATMLVGDLDFDSFDFMRLALVLDWLAPGAEVPDTIELDSVSLGDVYDLYERASR
jgi:acyl carrier protein